MSDHASIVARAVRWLRTHHRCSVVYAEMTTASAEHPDAIGWWCGLSRVVEVKVSRADFAADKRKMHASHEDAGMGAQRWYLVPAGLVEAHEVPAWCGLAYVLPRRIEIVKPAPDRDRYDARSEALVLTSAIRRHQLGSVFDARTGRWETLPDRLRRQASVPVREEGRT
ncbi:MAG: hypothetical protein ACRCSL_16710 [Microbacterium sp.]